VAGYAAGNETLDIIFRATVAMIICWFFGRGIGAIAQRAIDEHIDQYKQANPIPTDDRVQSDQGEQTESNDGADLAAQEPAGQQAISDQVAATPTAGT
jgi:hypothetical protein